MKTFLSNYLYVEKRKYAYLLSMILIVAGIGIGVVRGFNMGIDFTGGTMIQLNMGETVDGGELESLIRDQGIQANVTHAGEEGHSVIIKTTIAMDTDARTDLIEAIRNEYGISAADEEFIDNSTYIGPSIGELLKKNAVKALGFAAAGMLVYIIIRFEWMSAASAILALLHDVLVMIAFYGFFHVQINSPFIAAILTGVGYSINNTIVIYDRVRENKRLMKKNRLNELINHSITQTLSRTVMTSLTTAAAIIPLYVMGGSVIREFLLPLLVGVVGGTYSSIFIATPLYYDLYHLIHKPKYKGK
ncbi:MAG: protein translocase subunit SecF [Firmicutes bacterium]|nr:protein translocase subunit SecF [Bacillota bacterium]